jgi:hypothetical protein
VQPSIPENLDGYRRQPETAKSAFQLLTISSALVQRIYFASIKGGFFKNHDRGRDTNGGIFPQQSNAVGLTRLDTFGKPINLRLDSKIVLLATIASKEMAL